MLLSLFSELRAGVSLREILPFMIITIVCVVIALSFHELSHGWVAYKLGDPTARNLGRLTMNPSKHLDPIGTLCMLLFGFGWAKPVPVNTRYFKKGRRDMALTALAGPVSNILLAFVSTVIYLILYTIFYNSVMSGAVQNGTFVFNILFFSYQFFFYLHLLNLYLGFFNLIPVPPLDGSRILFIFLPDKYYFGIMKYERYIMIAMLALLYLGVLTTPVGWIAGKMSDGMAWIVGLIPGIATY